MSQQNLTYVTLWRGRRNLPQEERKLLNGMVRDLIGMLAFAFAGFLLFIALVYLGWTGVSDYLATQVLQPEKPLAAYLALSFILFLVLSVAVAFVGAVISAIVGGVRAHRRDRSVLRGAFVEGVLGESPRWLKIVTNIYVAVLSVGLAIGLTYHLHVTWGWHLAIAGVSAAACAGGLPLMHFATDGLWHQRRILRLANERARTETAPENE